MNHNANQSLGNRFVLQSFKLFVALPMKHFVLSDYLEILCRINVWLSSPTCLSCSLFSPHQKGVLLKQLCHEVRTLQGSIGVHIRRNIIEQPFFLFPNLQETGRWWISVSRKEQSHQKIDTQTPWSQNPFFQNSQKINIRWLSHPVYDAL